ncbi:MAG: tRNA (adenosine(37)-N6)-threonylcarbamoyltransferase complex dimerization subunit type 1 TsaB [Fimbriimonadaceae bacterium]|nr:tRNA (adenosine(37)-N6)-threonylcarbamoyltransferase complex dimerization subunit type 1 TsaB [Fimbriimonadaceae bacterium]QYK55308.1 MAG: tRNA (adenosine(37)-N6)-threonylcarbamoyltransferase complex dimerization subunit type 1 TsaB [Fimbriimonadaceae bacterium]
MKLVCSTSSPWVSAALFSAEGVLLGSAGDEGFGRASGTLARLVGEVLRSAGVELSQVEVFVADTGPGSFTGVRVGVTMAKAWAFALQRPSAGLTAFDLVACDRDVFVPSRKGEFFLRRAASGEVERVPAPPICAVGYGLPHRQGVVPDAANAGPLLARLATMDPAALVPTYLAEPSISTPKRAFGLGGTA